jgi:hypothetical protein
MLDTGIRMLDTGNRSFPVVCGLLLPVECAGNGIKRCPLDTNQRLFISALREETCLRAHVRKVNTFFRKLRVLPKGVCLVARSVKEDDKFGLVLLCLAILC